MKPKRMSRSAVDGWYCFIQHFRQFCLPCFVLTASLVVCKCSAVGVIYDTTPYFAPIYQTLGGMGQGQASTIGETFVAPAGAQVTLNSFSFMAESYIAGNLQVRPFIYAWSGNLTGVGGGATGSPIYMGSSFSFSPGQRPDGWTSMTATLGGGVSLVAGQQYVLGFTISDPGDYAASSGYIEFQTVPVRNPGYTPPPIPAGVDFGSGGAQWLNNSNNFAALNSGPWSTWGDIGAMAFTASFTVVPEPSIIPLSILGAALWLGRKFLPRMQAPSVALGEARQK